MRDVHLPKVGIAAGGFPLWFILVSGPTMLVCVLFGWLLSMPGIPKVIVLKVFKRYNRPSFPKGFEQQAAKATESTSLEILGFALKYQTMKLHTVGAFLSNYAGEQSKHHRKSQGKPIY